MLWTTAGVYRDGVRRRTVRPAGGARSRLRRLGAALSLAALAPSCQNLNLFTIEQDAELGTKTYQQMLAQERLVTAGPNYEMVNRAMERLVEAARVEDPRIVEAFEWEVNLIDNPDTVNAFALPGGKMAVYTGIIPVAGSEQGLAVVMGHEIGHVIARHGTKAMTRQLGTSVLIDILTEGDANQLLHLGNGFVQLSYGRDAELEADRRGLMYMARAGYDPREAVTFWQRMQGLGGSAPPELLSTHPAHDTRIAQIQDLLEEAIPIYEANKATPRPR